MPSLIRNPILPGFHPDPSILRVGDDYYVASSTFEWFPGVRLHHSRDLVHWRPLGYALTRTSQLDMAGNPRSGGVWAPCLTFAHGLFHLVYTDVKTWGFGFDDTHNYLVTAASIEGPWSEPVYLNSSGFDPSLFTDVDGRQWLVNMVWDPRPSRSRFGGIVLQEYCAAERRLLGEPRLIFRGTALGLTEGPHLYRRGEVYFLMVAEGGTGLDHAVSLARSSSITGPYEADPRGPLLTSKGSPETVLQKAGHASLVETQNGEWYLAHLCGRPVGQHGRCILGRETALQRVEWTADGWLRLADGGQRPFVEVKGPELPAHPFPAEPARDDFQAPTLGPHYQTLRVPADPSWLSLTERPGFLRLRGRESPWSLHRQSLVGRRLQSFRCRVETALELDPVSFQQMAGLMCLYDDQDFYYAYVSHDEELGRHLALLECRLGRLADVPLAPAGETAPTKVAPTKVALSASRIHLRAELATTELCFSYSLDGTHWLPLGGALDATILSDEHTTMSLGFTGAFAALAAHDVSGRRLVADFDYFDYQEL